MAVPCILAVRKEPHPSALSRCQLKSDPRKVLVVPISGDPEPVSVAHATINGIEQAVLSPSCGQVTEQNAGPGIRLGALIDAFPGRAVVESICSESLGSSLAKLGELVDAARLSVCLLGDIHDADKTAPGVQPECRAEFIGVDGARSQLAACDNTADPDESSSLPCYAIARDDSCDAQVELTLHGEILDLEERLEVHCPMERP